jgi:hypothetical protein
MSGRFEKLQGGYQARAFPDWVTLRLPCNFVGEWRRTTWISPSSQSGKQLNSSVFTADAPQMMIGIPT